MGSVLAGGEGWFDVEKKVLVLNNKSGHYRPTFDRLNNDSIRRLLDGIAPKDASDRTIGVDFQDGTKPR